MPLFRCSIAFRIRIECVVVLANVLYIPSIYSYNTLWKYAGYTLQRCISTAHERLPEVVEAVIDMILFGIL